MAAVLAHTKTLSSDEFEGRAPGTKGEELTVTYLVDQFKKVGLKPGNTDGTYIQKVPLVGITPTPAPLVVQEGRAAADARSGKTTWWRGPSTWRRSASLDNSELVFVGYGVVAPEFNWDDYKGVDVKGKTLVMLVNDPPVPDPANAGELDPKTFGGKAMTYYGRWTYKYEIGAQKGAAGVLIVHETGPAGYPFNVVQGKTGEQFDLVTPDKNMGRAAIEGWITLDQAKKLLQIGGPGLRRAEEAGGDARVQAGAARRHGVDDDQQHAAHDRLAERRREARRSRSEAEGRVRRLHGALGSFRQERATASSTAREDNALGCAALIEMARAFTKLPTPPRRSILFLAVTAEEQGLLGSQYYSVTPIYPLAKTLADINMDSWNVHGRTKDLTLIGYGASDLDDYARDAAGEQGRVVHGDAEPEKGFYYRSDHFNFAKQGVPALDPGRRRRLRRQAGGLRPRRCATSGPSSATTSRPTS